MTLTPEEQAELDALDVEFGQAAPAAPTPLKPPGLTPEEQAELDALDAEFGPAPVPPQPKPTGLTPEEQAELQALDAEFAAQPKALVAPAPKSNLAMPETDQDVLPPQTDDLEMEAWIAGIGRAETRGIKNPYAARNPQSSAVGRMQFIWSFWGKPGGHLKTWAENEDITLDEFANNPQMQEDYTRFYFKDQIVPQANRLAQKHAAVLKARGIQDIDDIRALVHFRGMDEADQFLRTGIPPKDGKAANKSIADYLADVRAGRNAFLAAQPKPEEEEEVVAATKAPKPQEPPEKDIFDVFRTREDLGALQAELRKFVSAKDAKKLDAEALKGAPGFKGTPREIAADISATRILPSELVAIARKYDVDWKALRRAAPLFGAPVAVGEGIMDNLLQLPAMVTGTVFEGGVMGIPQKLAIEVQDLLGRPNVRAALDDLRTIAQAKQTLAQTGAQLVGGFITGANLAKAASTAVKGLGKVAQMTAGATTFAAEQAISGAAQAEQGREVAGAATNILFGTALGGTVGGLSAAAKTKLGQKVIEVAKSPVGTLNKLRTRTSRALQDADPQFFEKAAAEAQEKFSESRSILNTTVISNTSIKGEDLRDATGLASKLGEENVDQLYKIAVETRPDKAKRIESEIAANVTELRRKVEDTQAAIDFARLAPENVVNLRAELKARTTELAQGVSDRRAKVLVEEIGGLRGMLADAAAAPERIANLTRTLDGLTIKLQKADIDPKAAVVRSHVENFVRGFASDILGTRVAYKQQDPLAALRVYTKQPERLQQDLERFFFKQHARAKIRAENYKAMPDAAPTLKRIRDATQASRWTAESLDRKYGTKLQMVLDGMGRQFNDLHAYVLPRARETSDLIKQTRAAGIEAEELYDALSTGNSADNPVVQGWRKFFDTALEDAKTLGVDIQARKNYVPVKMLPTDELAAVITKRVEELKGLGIVDLKNVAPDEEQLKKLRSIPEAKELLDSLDILSPGKGTYQDKLLNTLNDVRQGTVKNFGTARALKRAEEANQMPNLIRDKDVGRLAQTWVESVFKSGVMRQSLAEIRDYAELMKRVGDKNANKYLQNLLSDLTGSPRDGGLGKELSKLKNTISASLQEKKLQSTGVQRQVYTGIEAMMNMAPLLHKSMYGNALGVTPRQVVTNISALATMTMPELGYIQGGKLVAKSLLRTVNTALRGEITTIRTPELARKYKVNVGDTVRIQNLRDVLRNEGLASTQWNENLERTITSSLKKGTARAGTEKVVDTLNQGMLFMFEASETVMRNMTRHMAKDLTKLHGKGVKDYETFLDTLPRAYRKAVDGAKEPAEREKILLDYIIAKTVFNYNQASASEVSRSLGPILSSFTKWPTEIAGDTLNTFEKNGVIGGMADLVYRRFAPLLGLMVVGNFLEQTEPDKDSPLYTFVRKGDLGYMSPMSSLATIFEGEVAPPAVSIPAQAGKAVVTGDIEAGYKAAKDATRLYFPGAKIINVITDLFEEE